jgi:hypothetical protein
MELILKLSLAALRPLAKAAGQDMRFAANQPMRRLASAFFGLRAQVFAKKLVAAMT